MTIALYPGHQLVSSGEQSLPKRTTMRDTTVWDLSWKTKFDTSGQHITSQWMLDDAKRASEAIDHYICPRCEASLFEHQDSPNTLFCHSCPFKMKGKKTYNSIQGAKSHFVICRDTGYGMRSPDNGLRPRFATADVMGGSNGS